MKKVLFATTAIVLTAGAAAAQNVTITGTARVGLRYLEDSGGVNGRDTQVEQRLRFNFDASKETDAGVTFGGRIRMQYDENTNNLQGSDVTTAPFDVNGDGVISAGEENALTTNFESSGARLSAAYVYAEYEGLRVEVGNSNTAFDSVKLLYNSEIGFIGQTFGSYNGQSYYSFSTGPYGQFERNRMGIYAAYSISGFNVKASYVTPDQAFDDNDLLGFDADGDIVVVVNREEEFSMAVDYNFGAFTVAGAFALNGGGVNDNDVYFLGAEYAINPDANVGLHLNFTDADFFNAVTEDDDDIDNSTVTLYGNYKFGAITGRAYVAHNDTDGNETDFAVGIGADYDLGGATMAGHVARGYNEEIQASLGVKFSF